MKKFIRTMFCTCVLSSCAVVGPEYEQPSLSLSDQYVGGGNTALHQAASYHWWRAFNDPVLNEIVERGLVNSLDISIAQERLREASTAIRLTGFNAQIDGQIQADARRGRLDPDDSVDTIGSASANAAYVFDLFGGIRRGQEQAVAGAEAAQFDVGTVRLAYLVELVGAYIDARFFQVSASVSGATVANRQRTLQTVRRLSEAGEATELEVQQALAEKESAAARVPLLHAQYEASVHRIAQLLSEPSGPLLARMRQTHRQVVPPHLKKTGVPADLLRNRPDIRASERRFASSVAAIGVAEAALYPAFTLNGSVTVGTDDTWSFGPSLSVPVLRQPILQANREIAKSQAEQARLIWKQTVYEAVEDVQSEIGFVKYWRKQAHSLNKAAAATTELVRLSREAYNEGAISLDELLDAERLSFDNRISRAEALQQLAVSWTRLQAALGQGWHPYTVPPSLVTRTAIVKTPE